MRAIKTDPIRMCAWCGAELKRKRFSTGRLEDRGRFLKRQYCDTECQRLAQIDPAASNRQTMYSRSAKYRKTSCERCGATERLHVHHIDKDITNNVPANLLTLCAACHNRLHAAERQGIAASESKPSVTPSSPRSLSGSDGESSSGSGPK